MRIRYWTLLAAAVLLATVAGCAGSRAPRGPVSSPVPTKTLRPTFTATVPEPTLTPTPTEALPTETPVVVEPTATPEPPTPEPTATPEAAVLTVTSASLNVRSGPGTNYGVIGRLTNGQSVPVTGKNAAGTWWQFDYSGRNGWVIGTNVTVRNGELVQVAQNIPAAPTAAPRPTARPAAAQPAAPAPAPAPSLQFGLTGKVQLRPNTNPIVSVWCFVLNSSGNDLVNGTMRVLLGGSVLKEQAFTGGKPARGDAGYSSEYLYNSGCKVEVPASDGTYTAYLIDGGTQVSDAFTFTVSGDTNRTAIIEWKQK